MRAYACLLLLFGCLAAASAQLSGDEEQALSNALFLNNSNLNDLRFTRRTEKVTYELSYIDNAVDKPLETTANLMALHDKGLSIMPSELIRLGRLDILGDDAEPRGVLSIGSEPQIPDSIPVEVRPAVQDLAQAVEQADAYVHTALERLTPVEKRTLIDSLPAWAAQDKLVKFGFQLTAPDSPENIQKILAKVNLPLIRRAAEALALQTERELPMLETAARSTTWRGQEEFNFGGIKVEVSGIGDDFHSGKGDQLIIDLGGSNRYENRAGAGITGASLLVDCGDNDTFQQKDLGAGCGLLGIGLTYLLGKGNILNGASLSFGSGLGGVGVLYANGGDNRFSAGTLSEGFGEFGIGALVERGGACHYSATAWSQGAARTQGLGWLIAGTGDNLMELAGLSDPSNPIASKHSNGQGYSEGYEGVAGGVALLTMGSGEETLVGAACCQAGSYRNSLASLYQASGPHRFLAESKAQGYAQNQASSYLFSLNGDGSFVLNGDQGQSYAADGSVALLLDRSGSNTYSNGDGGPSIAVSKGLAIFIHGHGKNRYPSEISGGTSSEGLAIQVDMDGGTAPGQPSGMGLVTPGTSILLDQEISRHAVGAAFVAKSQAKPGSQPLPAEEQLQAIFASATNSDASSDQLIEARDQFVSFGVPGIEWLIQHKLLDADLAAETLIGSIAKSLGQPAEDELTLKIADANDAIALHALRICMQQDFKTAGVLVGGALKRPALQREAAYAAGEFGAKDAVPDLLALCGSPDEALVLNAVRSLTMLADPSALGTGQALLSSPDVLVRDAAIELVAATPGGFDVGKTLAKDPSERIAREGIQILGKIGSSAALDLAGRALDDVRSGVRIQALLALNGRVPTKYLSTIEELKQDPSALVRAVVAGLVLPKG